ncbi:MAG: Rrf2 family transcriptional regulator [Gemmatimonadetes bacterium]|nr:Rrf2 family transcriptional regulator [Gemmatimonadota bacterium]
MRVTTWAEYGLIVSVHLARRAGEGPVAAREMAEKEHLPADYVEQILLRLRRAGLVRSVRGARGGYFLARPPVEVTVKDVLDASEHGTFEINCDRHPVSDERCGPSGSCAIRPVWQLLQQKVDEVLSSVSLADLLHEEGEVRELVGLDATAS